MKRNNKEREQFLLREVKRNCDIKWNEFFNSLLHLRSFDHNICAQLMDECNNADMGLIIRGYRP